MPGKGRTRTLEVLRERETERICEERTRKSSSLEREALLLSVNTVVSKKDKQYAYKKKHWTHHVVEERVANHVHCVPVRDDEDEVGNEEANEYADIE